MTPPRDSDTGPPERDPDTGQSAARARENARDREQELRAGGAAAGIGSGAAFGGIEGAAVGAALEGGKSAGDSIRSDAEKHTTSRDRTGSDTRRAGASGTKQGSETGTTSRGAGAATKASSTARNTKSAMNVAAASSKREMAARGAGEAMKRSGSSTVKAAGTVLSEDGTMRDKAQQGAALAAGAAAATAASSTGVGTIGAKAAAEVTTRVVGSQAAQKHGWKVLLAVTAIALAPLLIVSSLMLIAIPVAAISVTSSLQDENTASGVCGPGNGGVVQLVGNGIEEKAWNYLTESGWSEKQAAGIMGNIWRESRFNPFAAETGGAPDVSSGWGLVQWTAGRHAAIRDAVQAQPELADLYVGTSNLFALPETVTPAEADAMTLFQLQYITTELTTNEKAAGDHLRQQQTVFDATISFESKYERSADWENYDTYGRAAINERVGAAKSYYNLFGSGLDVRLSAGEFAAFESSGGGSITAGGNGGTVAHSAATGATGATGAAGSAVTTSASDPCGQAGTLAASQFPQCSTNTNPACVNMGYFRQNSVGFTCAPGTTDAGTAVGYHEGDRFTIRLCNLDRTLDANGRPVQVNAIMSKQFVAWDQAMVEAGFAPVYTSTYRTPAKQMELAGANAASIGYSNHQFAAAFDISGLGASYSRHNCGGYAEDGACQVPAGGNQELWDAMHRIGLQHGLYIHDEEFWHIEFTPSGLESRSRPIPYEY